MAHLHVEYLKLANYAFLRNRIALCQYVELSNDSAEDWHDVRIVCSGEAVKTFESAVIPVVRAGQTLRLTGFCIEPIALSALARSSRCFSVCRPSLGISQRRAGIGI